MTAEELINRFRLQYHSLEEFGLRVTGVYDEESDDSRGERQIGIAKSCEDTDEINPERCHLSVMHPFVFDNRKIPEHFMGVRILNVVRADTIPPEFEEPIIGPAGFDVSFSPMHYERFVQANLREIRAILKEPALTYPEALDAICLGDFNKEKAQYEEWRQRRLLNT